MTIYNPRVGFEVISVAAGGTTSPADATPVTINVGRTIILVSPPAGWSAGSGNPPGGIALSGATAGDEIALRAADAAFGANGTAVYLPSGDTVFGETVTSFTVGSHAVGNGDLVRLTKVDATNWVFDRA